MTKQAHSEVFYGVGAIQLGDRPNKAGGAYLLRGGSFGCLRQNCPASLQLGGGGGGAHLEHVSVSPGTCSCENVLNFESSLKWLKMQLKLRWCGETYILSTRKNVDRKKLFSTKSHTV